MILQKNDAQTWIRNCPKCMCQLQYSTIGNLMTAERTGRKCRSCSKLGHPGLCGSQNGMYGKHHSENTKLKMRTLRLGTRCSEETKQKMHDAQRAEKHPNWGKHHSKKTIEKMRAARVLALSNPETKKRISDSLKIAMNRPEVKEKLRLASTGKQHSNETKKKMSEAHLVISNLPEIKQKYREIRLGKVTPNFNLNACKIIDEYGKKNGYNFQHAENGGEVHVIGYSVDGYDKEKNVVIEYYEKHHRYKTEHDEQRKQDIINHLNCKFIELKEWGDI